MQTQGKACGPWCPRKFSGRTSVTSVRETDSLTCRCQTAFVTLSRPRLVSRPTRESQLPSGVCVFARQLAVSCCSISALC